MATNKELGPQDRAAMEAWRSGARGQDVMDAWNAGSFTPKTQIPESRSFDQPEQQQQQDTNPINKFNSAVLDLLKKAQGMEHDTGAVKTEYEKEAFEAENAPLEGNLANLSPEQQWSVRGARGGVYDKSLQFVDTKLKQIRDVNSMLKETYNEDWSKLVPPSEKETEAMRIALRAGRNLTADELKRYGKNFTEDDWNMWAEQNKKGEATGTPPTSYKEWELAGGQGGTGKTYNEWISTKNKKPAPASFTNTLADFNIALGSWNNIKSLAEELKTKIGPTKLLNYKGTLQQFARQYGDARLAVLLAEVEKGFQLYRKETTGAQASDKELKMLRPNLPSITESPAVFFGKLDKTIEGTKRAYNSYIDTYSAAGYDIGFLERLEDGQGSVRQQVIDAGFDYDAMKSDGMSDEEIKAALKIN